VTGRPPKLTPDQVREIRYHRAAGFSTVVIARVFGVSKSTALRYLRGECKHHQERAA
jgi:IS30 family transposase